MTQAAKRIIDRWRAHLYDLNPQQALRALTTIAPDARFRLGHPFGEFADPESFFAAAFTPLMKALPDLERRDYLILSGEDEWQHLWVGCAGYYTGSFFAPWLDIPPSGHQVHMRFHEFYRIADGMVKEFQGLWDIPEVMIQTNTWPLAPSLGREWLVPAPATQDGLAVQGTPEQATATRQLIIDMLSAMKRHPRQPAQTMELERYWHPALNWYGPAGIGTARGIAGFRHWHQIPFLTAMPDRGQHSDALTYHFFAEGNFAAVTGWPNMLQTISHGGWLGIPPVDKKITLRSLDFWRVEQGKIRENWVLVDLLDVYRQIGVDVFARLGEMNKARPHAAVNLPDHY